MSHTSEVIAMLAHTIEQLAKGELVVSSCDVSLDFDRCTQYTRLGELPVVRKVGPSRTTLTLEMYEGVKK